MGEKGDVTPWGERAALPLIWVKVQRRVHIWLVPGMEVPIGQHHLQFGLAVDVEFLQYVAQVGFDSVGRDDHLAGNFVVGVPNAGEGRCFFFAIGQGFPEAEIFVCHVVFPQGKAEQLIDRLTRSQALPHSNVDDKGHKIRIYVDPALAMEIAKAFKETLEKFRWVHAVPYSQENRAATARSSMIKRTYVPHPEARLYHKVKFSRREENVKVSTQVPVKRIGYRTEVAEGFFAPPGSPK